MHILLMGYLFVIAMIAVTSDSLIQGGLFLFFLGILPCWLILWRMLRKQVKHHRSMPSD